MDKGGLVVENSRGIVYVATKQERYIAEAFLSATSVKDLAADIPITLFTDLPDSVFAKASCFDAVIPIDSAEKFGRSWSEGQLDRIKCLPHSPYSFTLHLDADTRIRNPEVVSAFDILEQHDIAMVECSEDNSYSREKYGQPMFNVGFILYRKSARVMDLLRCWERTTKEFFQIASSEEIPQIACLSHVDDPDVRRKLLFMDQLSMVQLLSPTVNKCDVDCKILSERWNYRGSNSGRPAPTDVIVDHHPELRNRYFIRDLALASMRCQSQGEPQLALAVLRWLDNHSPGQMDVMKLIVMNEVHNKNYHEAVESLDRLLFYYPGYTWANSAKSKIVALMVNRAPVDD